MPRPRVAIPGGLVVRWYCQERVSVREVARRLGRSRVVVMAFLASEGIEVRERSASLLARSERQRRRVEGRCGWLDCGQAASGEFCYWHAKAHEGLVSA